MAGEVQGVQCQAVRQTVIRRPDHVICSLAQWLPAHLSHPAVGQRHRRRQTTGLASSQSTAAASTPDVANTSGTGSQKPSTATAPATAAAATVAATTT